MLLLTLVLIGYSSSVCVSVLQEQETVGNRVLVLAFSGLRWDIMNISNMSSFKKIIKYGFLGKRKIDPFQTESLPSFMSMVTGEYPNIHGMVSNKMKDLKTGENFDVKNTNQNWWSKVNPVWITNQQSGNISALCYWPGHDVIFHGIKVNYTCSDKKNLKTVFDDPFREMTLYGDILGTSAFEKRVNQVKKWLALDKLIRPSFIGVYFEEPLRSIMKYGFKDNKTKAVLLEINNIVNNLLSLLESDAKDVNLIVTGESGVTEITNQIFLDDLAKELRSSYKVIDEGPIMTILPDSNTIGKELLKKLSGNSHLAAFDGYKLPKNFHFYHPNRTMPVILTANEHLRIYPERIIDKKKALMGYDGKFPSTHSLVLGYGPNFMQGSQVNALGNIDIYHVICEVLHISPKAKKLNKSLLDEILVKREQWYVKIVKKVTESTLNLILAFIIALTSLFAVAYLICATLNKLGGCCKCSSKVTKLKVAPTRLLRRQKHNEKGGRHLLSDDEVSSDLSETDEDLREAVKIIKQR